MGRAPRADEAGGIYHAVNRGNAKNDIFFKKPDFEAFERLIAEGLEMFPVDLIAYQWMKNHWQMVLSPQVDGGMSTFLWLDHPDSHAAVSRTSWDDSYGHVDQGRYKSFPVRPVRRLPRCVARVNAALSQKEIDALVRELPKRYLTPFLLHAAVSRTSWDDSYGHVDQGRYKSFPVRPVRRLPRCVARVNAALSQKEIDALVRSETRGIPFSDETWTENTIKRLGLESLFRPRGRPKNLA